MILCNKNQVTLHNGVDCLRFLSFPKVFFSEESTVIKYLANVGSSEASFFVRIIKQSEAGYGCDETFLNVLPKFGRVRPAESIPLTFTFVATAEKRKISFVSQNHERECISMPGFIEISYMLEDENPTRETKILRIPFFAKSEKLPILLQVATDEPHEMRPNSIDFGPCPLKESCSRQLTLTNNSKDIPVQYEFSKTANYRVQPSGGTIRPNRTQVITATFTPRQLGKICSKAKIVLSGRTGVVVRELEVRLTGEGVGTLQNKAKCNGSYLAELNSNVVTVNRVQLPTQQECRLNCMLLCRYLTKVLDQNSINFGRVCLNTTATMNLCIENTSDSPINLGLLPNDKQISTKCKKKLRIQPKEKVDFEVSLKPTSIGSFEGAINIQVGGAPYDAVKIESIVELPCLELDQHPIILKPKPHSTCFVSVDGLRRYFQLKNPLNEPMHLKWTPVGQSEGFKISPQSGTVPAKAYLNCMATYHYSFSEKPEMLRKTVFKLSTFINQPVYLEGKHIDLEIETRLPPPKIFSPSKRIKMHDAPYNLETCQIFTLQNRGAGPAFINISHASTLPDVQLVIHGCPKEIRSQESADFKVTCISRRLGYFEIPLSIRHAGQEVSRMTLQLTGVFPKINVSPSLLKIRSERSQINGVPIGAKATKDFTVKNVSSVPAEVGIDLDGYNDFALGMEGDGVLKPSSSRTYKLTFKPQKISNFEFYLSINVNGKKIEENLCKVVANSYRSWVKLTPNPIIFKYSHSLTSHTESIRSEVEVQNCTNRSLQWQIDSESLPPWLSITYSNSTTEDLVGVLSSNEPIKLTLNFEKEDHSTNYRHTDLPITFQDEHDSQQRVFLSIKVEHMEANLKCHPEYLFLPPIPTHQRIKLPLRLYIESVSGDLKLEDVVFTILKQDKGVKYPFKIDFPDGMTFGKCHSGQELKAVISIESQNKFSISNQPQPPCLVFIVNSTPNRLSTPLAVCMPFVFSVDDSAFSLVHFRSHPNTSTDEFLNYHSNFNPHLVEIVTRWLQHYGFDVGIHGIEFPDDLQRCLSLADIKLKSSASLRKVSEEKRVTHTVDSLVECFAHIVGVWNPPGIPRSITLPIEDATACLKMLYERHAALISCVESKGGCVGHIAPECLMTYDDYRAWFRVERPCNQERGFRIDIPFEMDSRNTSVLPRIVQSSISGGLGLSYPQLPEIDKEKFELISRVSWTDLFLQVLKIFEVREGYEGKLLRWTQEAVRQSWCHLCDSNSSLENAFVIKTNPPKVRNFDDDLSNGLVIAVLLVNNAPFTANELLSNIYLSPKSFEERFHNAIEILKALGSLRINVNVTPEDIVHPNALQMILFLTRLHHYLPEYTIQSVIEFKGNVRECVSKDLRLTNPTNRSLHYQCFFLGKNSDRFSLKIASSDAKTRELELKESSETIISLLYNVEDLQATEIHLLFVSKSGLTPRAPTLVYKLKGDACTLSTEEVIYFKTSCYRPLIRVLPVRSPFKDIDYFNISTLESPPGRLRGFTCRQEQILLSSESPTDVEIAFHPFSTGEYTGKLVFTSVELGEFYLELRGRSTIPKEPSYPNRENVYRIECEAGVERDVSLLLPMMNPYKLSALKWVAEYTSYPRKLTGIPNSADFFDQIEEKLMSKHFKISNSTRKQFKIISSSGELKLTSTSIATLKGYKRNGFQIMGLPIRVLCFKPGISQANIRLESDDDIRLLKVQFEASEVSEKDQFEEFDKRNENMTLANEPKPLDPTLYITDDIEKLIMRSSPDRYENSLYCGKLEIKCQVGQCAHKKRLQLDEHTVTILLPKNSTKMTQAFLIESDIPKEMCRIDSMIVAKPGLRGRCLVTVPLKRRLCYNGYIKCIPENKNERETDDATKNFSRGLLYEVNIRIKPAPPSASIETSSHCLEINRIEIPLEHLKLSISDGNIEVLLDGANVQGPKSIDYTFLTYVLDYIPTSVGMHRASVIFYNESRGEFWIEVKLKAEQPRLKMARKWKCELGRSSLNLLKIENPTTQAYKLAAQVINTDAYKLEGYSHDGENDIAPIDRKKTLPLPPKGTLCLAVSFTPQEYGDWSNSGEIVLTCQEFGELRVRLDGEGCLPSPNEGVCVTSEIRQMRKFTVLFNNPFPYSIGAKWSLESPEGFRQPPDDRSGFKVLEKGYVTLKAKETYDFNLQFCPMFMQAHQSLFRISAFKMSSADGGKWDSSEISWITPLIGVPTMRGLTQDDLNKLPHESYHPCQVSKPPPKPLRIEGKAGQSTPIKLSLNLTGYVASLPSDNGTIEWWFEVNNPQEDDLINSGELIGGVFELTQTKPSEEFPGFELSGVFRPSRSMRISATLCIRSKAGGVWQFPVDLLSRPTGHIERRLNFAPGGLHKSDCKRIRLDSRLEGRSEEFRAFLSEVNGEEFDIDRTKGLLPAKGDGYFILTVRFTRRCYGREARAKLIIQTPTQEWTYELIGEDLR